MKRLHKRILTVCLALMMSLAFAVPAFAAEIQPRYTLGVFAIWNVMPSPSDAPGANPYLLNVNRSTEVSANYQKLTLYPGTGSRDQQFAIAYSGVDGKPRMYNAVGYDPVSRTGYSLNMDVSTYACMLMHDSGDDYHDAEIDTRSTYYNGIKVIRIILPNRGDRALSYRSNIRNEQLYWDSWNDGVNQMWHFGLDG